MKKRMRESSIETVKLFFRYGAFYLLIFMLFSVSAASDI